MEEEVHELTNCFTSLVGLVDKTDSRPFGDSPKRTHTGFDCKVKHPAWRDRSGDTAPQTLRDCFSAFVFRRHGPFVAIRVAEMNACRTVFTPRTDPLRPPSVLDQTAVEKHLARHCASG